MDYPCTKFGDFILSHCGFLSCGQTAYTQNYYGITDDTKRLSRAIGVIVRKYRIKCSK